MNQYLRDYQQEGVQFLYSRYSSNAGGVLCDDMGLGKTVQVRRIQSFLSSWEERDVCASRVGEGDVGNNVLQVIAFMCAVLGKTGTKADVILTNPRQVCVISTVGHHTVVT